MTDKNRPATPVSDPAGDVLVPQRKLILTIEPESRYDLKPFENAPDDLCRVIVDTDDGAQSDPPHEVLPTMERPPDYLQLIGLAAADLDGEAARIWSVGEARPHVTQMILNESAAMTLVVSRPHKYDFVMYRLISDEVRIDTRWPADGFCSFCFDRDDSPFERLLSDLEANARSDPASAVARYEKLRWIWWSRSGIREACADAKFCITPDGPHCEYYSFHSSRLRSDVIAGALENAAVSNGMGVAAPISAAEIFKRRG